MQPAQREVTPSSRGALPAFGIAAAAGMTHGLFTLYWAVGGNWLVSTLGSQLVATFADRRYLLLAVAAVKLGFAVLPLLLLRRGSLGRRPWRVLCWAGAAVLVAWGGLNTVTGNLVLAGLVQPAGGYDHDGMVGHAWLWDPLFLVWGGALMVGLLVTRVSRRHYG